MQTLVLNAANLLLSPLPWRVRRHLINNTDVVSGMLTLGGRRGLDERAKELSIKGRWTKSTAEPSGPDPAPLVRALGAAFVRMKAQQRAVNDDYLPAPT